MSIIFTEKYRPEKREEIVGNKSTLDKIFNLVASGNLPHLIFEGPAGVGKTSTALVIAHQLFGDFYRSNFEELNASDERGINVVRNQIKTFAKTVPLNATFKILLLDESDKMTDDAQNALRRTMEKYSNITKFIFVVNHVEKLIDPIRSRCEEFRFGPISTNEITKRLGQIYLAEKIHGGLPTDPTNPTPNEALMKIAEYSHGDMRKAINHLQLLLAQNKPLTPEMVESIKPTNFGELIYGSIVKGRFLEARKTLWRALELGYTERYIIDLLHKIYIGEELNYDIKTEAVFALAEADYRMTLGINKMLAMDDLFFKLMRIHV